MVILNRADYIQKMSSILEDLSKFKHVSQDITKSRETSLINYLLRLKNDGTIDESEYKTMKPCGSTPGIMYGLPTVKKDDCPMCPIVSSIGTYNYDLAKYLVTILKPISKNNSSVKDSFAFVDWIKTKQNSGGGIMCSFDISSLFTNVSIDETIEICIKKLYASPNPPKFPKSVLRKLLQFATKKSHFTFNGNYYDFADGMAMGSPLAPVLADIFMINFEEKYISSLPTENVKPSVWKRYVDDTFCLFSSRDSALQFLEYLNSRHPNIKFTHEFEEESKIPFLDVLIIKEGENFQTSIFRKKTVINCLTLLKVPYL